MRLNTERLKKGAEPGRDQHNMPPQVLKMKNIDGLIWEY